MRREEKQMVLENLQAQREFYNAYSITDKKTISYIIASDRYDAC